MKTLKELSVVYVEDEPEVREGIARALKRRVGVLETAANGKEGLALFLQQRPDMLITDLEMPVMDGLEMVRQVRAQSPESVIIVVTAYKDEAHHTDLADGYVYKPVDIWRLVEMMEMLAQQKR